MRQPDTRPLALVLVGVVGLLATVPAAAAEPMGLGFGLSGGWNVGTQKWQPFDHGGVLGGSVSLESGYFLTPVLGVHHAWLAGDAGAMDLGSPLGVVQVENSLRSLGVLLGPAIDVGPVRLGASVGLYWLLVESTVDGVRISPTTTVLGYALSAEGWVWRWTWGQIGGVATAHFLAEAQIAYFVAGLTLRLDFELTE